MAKHIENLVGKRFGMLECIEYSHQGKGHESYWVFKCDCGNKKIIRRSNVILGRTISCGCYGKEQRKKSTMLGFGEAAKNHVWCTYKANARNRNIPFELSKNYFNELIKNNCYYCGKPPSQIAKSKDNTGDYIYNGVDRVDSSKGYIEGNVVPCCGRCNEAKMSETQEDFLDWVTKVYKHSVLKEI